MKITINGYVYARVYEWKDEPDFSWCTFDPTDIDFSCETLVLGRHEITFEVPDDFDVRAAKIAILENKAERVRAEFAKKIDEINDRISKLRALEYNHE